MRFAVVVFPGSNCDADCFHIARDLLGCEAEYIWHKDTDLKGADAVILPGGFAYGDYLRAGALARFSPVMESVANSRGRRPVLGICNGFRSCSRRGSARRSASTRPSGHLPDVFMRVETTRPCSPSTSGTGRQDADRPRRGNHGAGPDARGARRERRDVPVLRRPGKRRGRGQPQRRRPRTSPASRTGRECRRPHAASDRCSEGILGNDVGRKMFESAVVALAAR